MSTAKTPVLFIIFNRLPTAQRVFQAIRGYRPEKLYVAADGPRAAHPEDPGKCAAVRALISKVDWPCEVFTLFQTRNLDCKMAIISAVNWFFRQEPEGIVLEDDCLPGVDFFSFCHELLDRYRDDNRVMHIGGVNLQKGQKRGSGAYYFSNIASIWGWAGWRRSWALYDVNMSLFPEFEHYGLMVNLFPDERVAAWVTAMARSVYEGRINTYDYQMAFSFAVNHGLSISPNVNLVSNIGFTSDARHTTDSENVHANIPVEPLGDMIHPEIMMADKTADLFQLALSMSPLDFRPAPAAGGAPFNTVKRLLHAVKF